MDSIKQFIQASSQKNRINVPSSAKRIASDSQMNPQSYRNKFLPLEMSDESSSQSSLESDPNAQNLDSDEMTNNNAYGGLINEEEINVALALCKKIKKISKRDNGLTKVKKQHKGIGKLFKKMSQFFGLKHKRMQKLKKQKKQLKQLRKQAQKMSGILKQQRQNVNRYNQPQLQPALTEKIFDQIDAFNDIEPQPQSQQQVSQPQKESQFQPQSQPESKPQLQQPSISPNLSKSPLSPSVQQNQSIRTICYICKVKFNQIHHFYPCLCIKCGDFNYSKRTQTADLRNLTAVVTGGRIKIGFEIALKLLRDGANVFVTSRFFNDTLLRYQQEKDYLEWQNRLFIIECDFTSTKQVDYMLEKIKSHTDTIDILINNAAQTIVRPKEFYRKEVENSIKQTSEFKLSYEHMEEFNPGGLRGEMIRDGKADDTNTDQQVRSRDNQQYALNPKATMTIQQRYPSLFINEKQENTNTSTSANNKQTPSQQQPQHQNPLSSKGNHCYTEPQSTLQPHINAHNATDSIMITKDSIYDVSIVTQSDNPLINHQKRDAFNQPIDMRPKNSWVEKLSEVSLIDCLSTQIVNSVVPFYIIGQLKPLMSKKKPRGNQASPYSWVENVSSMEGVFYRCGKQAKHPHTNMAKASLNMITRTSANEFQCDNIYMNSIDTGWVTEENPFGSKEKKLERFIPLDCIDGAMRVLDPIYQGINHNQFPFGKFLKDYQESRW